MPAALPILPDLRGPTADELPRELYLEVTNRCNLRCLTCPQSFGMPEPPADLSLAQVERIVAQLPRLDRVVLHGVGEPILNAELPAMVALVKRRGAHVLFNSNGILLRREQVDPLVAAGLDEIRVSIDAARRETYEAVRGADAFDKIIENIRGVTARKGELGRDNPRLSLWMTGLHTSVGELPELVRLAARIGIGEVYVQRLVISERGLATRAESLVTREAPLSPAIEEAEILSRELGVSLRGSGNASPAATLARRDANGAPWRGCRRPWTLTYVTANGNVLPCCIVPFTSVPYAGAVLGNVFADPLDAIWNGASYQRWRGAMLDGAPPAACSRCGTDWSL